MASPTIRPYSIPVIGAFHAERNTLRSTSCLLDRIEGMDLVRMAIAGEIIPSH